MKEHKNIQEAKADAVEPSGEFGCSDSVYDKNGRPIMPGDTLKIYHYRAALRREHRYMYKYVIGYDHNLSAIEVSHLIPFRESYWIMLDGKTHRDIEIVQGYAGVKRGCDYRDRMTNEEVSG